MAFLVTSLVILALMLLLVFSGINESLIEDKSTYMGTSSKQQKLATETHELFQDSQLPTLSSTLILTTTPKDKKLVMVCGRRCSGIADRVRGIPFVVSMALLTQRELIIDRSLLSSMPDHFNDGTPYNFRDDCSKATAIASIKDILKDNTQIIYIKSTCYILPSWREILVEKDERLYSLDGINQECNTLDSAYLCGAAALHHVKEFKSDFFEVHRLLDGLEKIMPRRNYTVIQIRAGGSNISIGNTSVKALPWGDKYISEVPNMWIQAFRDFKFSGCKNNIVLISDSARIISEIRYAVNDGIMITHCCNQPLHRDRTTRQEFFWQEVIDLFIMSRSRQILAGNGHFVTLGRYWLGKGGPDIKRAQTKNEIQDAVFQLLKESQCDNLEANQIKA